MTTFGDIGKVYAALSTNKDWYKRMDRNEDGIITKAECSEYLANDCASLSGMTSSEKEDLIDKFWKVFDTNRSAQKIAGTNLKNVNALDKVEQTNLKNSVDKFLGCKSIFEQTLTQYLTEVPPQLKGKFLLLWKNKVSESLNSYFSELISKENNIIDYSIKDKIKTRFYFIIS